MLTNTTPTRIFKCVLFEISFNYDVEKINFLTANNEVDTEIVNALNKLKTNNYTIDIFSDNLESDARLFVTNDIVYHHKDKEYEGMSDGDTLYVKNLDNTYYTKYIYSKSENDFIKMSASATLDSFIPGFNKVKANLFNKISTNQYVFNYAEAKLNAELLLAPNYNFFPGNNQKASITLVDGEIRNISVLAESSSIVVINENIYNQGNTTIPSWIDLSLIA